MRWKPVIGLEIHAQLLTQTKLFCGCPTSFHAPANTQVCPICLGHPGVLPSVNRRAVELAVRIGLGLGAAVHLHSVFARKNYFYPDLPKGYQITQYREPLCEGGAFGIFGGDKKRNIRVLRIHLEEDAGRSHHPDGMGGQTRLDLNRCGIPLAEIVTEPELRSPEEAHEAVRVIRRLLIWLDACDGNMEEGSLRCDANVSLRPERSTRLGVRTELKNLNSMRFLRQALRFEIDRQRSLLERGEEVAQETRHWDEAAGCTLPMRGKEEVCDYRYFPEPDLPPLWVESDWIEEIRRQLPELPERRIERFRRDEQLPPSEVEILTATRHLADFFEAVVAAGAEPKVASSWIVNERFLEPMKHGPDLRKPPIQPSSFAFLLREMTSGRLSRRQAKEVLTQAVEEGVDPALIIERQGTRQINDPDRIGGWIEGVLSDHPDQVVRFLSGRSSLARFFIGEVIKASRGEANPAIVARLLDEALEKRRNR